MTKRKPRLIEDDNQDMDVASNIEMMDFKSSRDSKRIKEVACPPNCSEGPGPVCDDKKANGNGANGRNGVNGANGRNGGNGVNGANGRNGVNGGNGHKNGNGNGNNGLKNGNGGNGLKNGNGGNGHKNGNGGNDSNGDNGSNGDEEHQLSTIPPDPRWPNQNVTNYCFFMFVDYHRCIKKRGDDYEPCEYFQKAYKGLCPNEWVERWQNQMETGTFPRKFEESKSS